MPETFPVVVVPIGPSVVDSTASAVVSSTVVVVVTLDFVVYILKHPITSILTAGALFQDNGRTLIAMMFSRIGVNSTVAIVEISKTPSNTFGLPVSGLVTVIQSSSVTGSSIVPGTYCTSKAVT